MASEDKQRLVLSNRVLGEVIPISIATALAIESLVGKNPDAPVVDSHLPEVDLLVINVRTLVRNLLGAIQKEDKLVQISGPALVEYIIQDINIINQTLAEYASDTLDIVFYVPTYKSIYNGLYKHGILKESRTPNQIYQNTSELYVVDNLITVAKEQSIDNVISVDANLDKYPVACAMLTHYPVDLLNRYQFNSLYLLESHTGALKGPTEWNTKLTGGKANINLPFDRATLQVFGDGVMFISSKSKLRSTFRELAERYKWTARSTPDLVKFSATQLSDPFFDQYVKELYRN